MPSMASPVGVYRHGKLEPGDVLALTAWPIVLKWQSTLRQRALYRFQRAGFRMRMR